MMRIAFLLFLALMATNTIASTDQQLYIVRMDKTKIPASYSTTGNSRQFYEAVLNSVSEISIQEQEEGQETTPPEIIYVYEKVISGFAAKLSTGHLKALSQIDGFISAVPDELRALQTTHSAQFLGLHHGGGLWSNRNLASDVIIGVIDTGVWPEHPSFSDKGVSAIPSKWKGKCVGGTKFSQSNCNKKLIGARTYLKGYQILFGKINNTIDYESPRDKSGHGTHTASTAAGAIVDEASIFGLGCGTANGMDYTARISIYKACGIVACVVSDIAKAIDKAVADGVDIISISITGRDVPYHLDPVAIASFEATGHGVLVTCSAGNSGPVPSTIQNIAPWILTVAASYTDRSFPTIVKLGNGQAFVGASIYSGKATKQFPLVYGATAGSGLLAKYCFIDALNNNLVKGKIVVCEEGNISLYQVGEDLKLAGAAGMLILNIDVYGEEQYADPHRLPSSKLGVRAAKAIRRYLYSAKNPTASIASKGTIYGDRAPRMAAFSSRGPSKAVPDVIKPDVTAPGLNILAAWPSETSPTTTTSDPRRVLFNILSGTSMSCPHVSGLAALIKSLHKDWSPAAIKSALMTTAYVLDNRHSPIVDVANSKAATLFAFGSGHVDPERAADPGLIYNITTKDYLMFLCSLNYTFTGGDFSCPKNKVLLPGDLNYPSFSVGLEGNGRPATYTFKRRVTNVGTASSTFTVEVDEPNGVSVRVNPRVLRFKKLGEKKNYRVSFVGLGRRFRKGHHSFGSLVWVSGKYGVRSPIAVTWK